MSKPPAKESLKHAVLAKLCQGQQQWVGLLREVVARWRTTKFDDRGYPVVRMKVKTWAKIMGAPERTIKHWFSAMSKAGVVHTRVVRAKEGTGFVVAPSLEVQIECRAYIAETGRKPRPVPDELIAGIHPDRLDRARRNYMFLLRRQMKFVLDNPDLVEGGAFYKNAKKVLHKLPKGTGDAPSKGKTAHPVGANFAPTEEEAKTVPSSTEVYPSGIPLFDAKKLYAISLSTPAEPGIEGVPFGEKKGEVSGKVIPDSDSVSESDFLPGEKNPGATVLDSNPTPTAQTVGGLKLTAKQSLAPSSCLIAAKIKGVVANPHEATVPDSLSGLQPVFDDTAWQKGVSKTWRDTMVAAGHKPLMLGAAEIKMLKNALAFFQPKEKLEALAFLIQNWGKSRSWVSVKFAIYEKTIPTTPTPGKLVFLRTYAKAFWDDRAEIVGKANPKALGKKDYQTVEDAAAFIASLGKGGAK